MEFIVLLLVVIGLPLFLGIVLYNRFVALKQRRENAFADIVWSTFPDKFNIFNDGNPEKTYGWITCIVLSLKSMYSKLKNGW